MPQPIPPPNPNANPNSLPSPDALIPQNCCRSICFVESRKQMSQGEEEEAMETLMKEVEMLLDEIPRVLSPPLVHDHRHRLPFDGDGDRRINHGTCAASSSVQGRYGSAPSHQWLLQPPLLLEQSPSPPSVPDVLSNRLFPAYGEPAGRHNERMVQEVGFIDSSRNIHLGFYRQVTEPIFENGPVGPSLSNINFRNDEEMQTRARFGHGAYCQSVLHNSPLFHLGNNIQWSQLQALHKDSGVLPPWLWNAHGGDIESGAGVERRNSHKWGNASWGFPSSTNLPSEISYVNRSGNSFDASKLYHNFPGFSQCTLLTPPSVQPQQGRILGNCKAFGCGGNSLIQGGEHNYARNRCNEHAMNQYGGHLYARRVSAKHAAFPSKSKVMCGNGCLYNVATDHFGCRFLQRKIDAGKHQVDMIFNGVIDHTIELMIHPFGNYLMQKLLDVCSEEQLMCILHLLMENPADFISISLNNYGTRPVQRLIYYLKNRQQIAIVVSTVLSHFLYLIKDPNGSHVLQQCFRSFTSEDNKLIFTAAAKHCVDIATYQYGCCVLQKCIAHSTGKCQEKLVAEICSNSYKLARNAYGNYVIQYILDLNMPSATRKMASQFKGNYVDLSMQKFSSNVVEKCLKIFGDDDRATIVFELISVSHFDLLLQDPYANYVIKSALRNTKGSLYAALRKAILPHEAALKTNQFSKGIFSLCLLKK